MRYAIELIGGPCCGDAMTVDKTPLEDYPEKITASVRPQMQGTWNVLISQMSKDWRPDKYYVYVQKSLDSREYLFNHSHSG
jgi:hypothetical protein